jgi:hypothetical protein
MAQFEEDVIYSVSLLAYRSTGTPEQLIRNIGTAIKVNNETPVSNVVHIMAEHVSVAQGSYAGGSLELMAKARV